ncbi:hypothetical protein P7A61_04030 [Clostridium perfringens]|nr:hypothetical protein [Clostridium perfringens]
MEKYIIEEETKNYKGPKLPKSEDYFDINESLEERRERIYLYSEVKENE